MTQSEKKKYIAPSATTIALELGNLLLYGKMQPSNLWEMHEKSCMLNTETMPAFCTCHSKRCRG